MRAKIKYVYHLWYLLWFQNVHVDYSNCIDNTTRTVSKQILIEKIIICLNVPEYKFLVSWPNK